MRTFVGSVLEAAGDYIVDEVGDGFDALRLVPRADYDLVITDINMPDINGLELIHAIRQHARHARTPLVVITTNDRAYTLRAGKTPAEARDAKAERRVPLRWFAATIRDGRDPADDPSSLANNLIVMRILEAARRSAACRFT